MTRRSNVPVATVGYKKCGEGMLFDTVTILTCAVLAVLAVWSSLADMFFRKLHEDVGEEPSVWERPPVSVIVVADNNARELRENLSAFLAQDYPPGFEVIVVIEKDEDGTADVLKAFAGSGNLYTTFVPASSRYMSRRKLAVTLGVKAARNEWILLTDAECRPASPRWISCMASRCGDGVDMVLGYGNYPAEAGGFRVFSRFRHEYAMLRMASLGKAYAAGGSNLMFRKGMFMAGNGFRGNLKYLRGEYDFLVNKYAAGGGVAVEASPQAHVVEEAPTRKEWHDRNVFYRETRRRLSGGAPYKLGAGLDMISLYACMLAAVLSSAYAVVAHCWLVLPFSLAALVLPWLSRTRSAGRAMSRFGVSSPRWKVVPYELRIVWHNAKYALAYRRSDKYDFISHKS